MPKISKAFPRITSIEPQKKKADRYNIFLDNKFAFGLGAQILLQNSLKVGKVITDVEITKIIAREELSKLTDLATNFLSYRPRSEKEINEYLAKKIAQREKIKYTQATQSPLIKKVTTMLKKYKYINDLEFAKWYIDSRIRARPKGLFLIKIELRRKGISDEIIDSLLVDSTKELDLAKRALTKKMKRWQKLSKLDLKKKVYQFLASRGFDFETIKDAFAFISKKG